MGTISDKLTYLNTTKSQLKDMINYGLPTDEQITSSTTFRNYVSSIFNAFLEALRTPDTLFTNLPKKSGTGAVITLNDTANAPMRISLSASELIQDGTPTPSSPQAVHTISGSNTIKVRGKNLIDIASTYTLTEYKTIQVDIPAGTYVLSVDNRISTADSSLVLFQNGNTTISQTYLSVGSLEKNINLSTKVNKMLIYSGSNYTESINVETTFTNLMVSKDGGTYEPYISQEAEVDLGYENLLDYNYLVEANADKTYQGYGFWAFKLSEELTTFTLSRANNTMFAYGSYIAIGQGTDLATAYTNKSWLMHPSLSNLNNKSITLTNTGQLWLFTGGSKSNITSAIYYAGYIQLEKGSTAHTYTEYGKAIQYCKIGNYEDRIFKNISGDTDYSNTREEGAWYIKKNIGKTIIDSSNVDDLVLNFGQTNNKNRINIDKSKLGWQTSWTTGVCLMNKYKEITTTSEVESGKFAFSFGQTIIIIWNDDFTDLETAKTELLGTEIYIAQATPTYTQITGTLEEQIENVYQKLLSYSGTTNISQINNDLSFNLSVQAIEEL